MDFRTPCVHVRCANISKDLRTSPTLHHKVRGNLKTNHDSSQGCLVRSIGIYRPATLDTTIKGSIPAMNIIKTYIDKNKYICDAHVLKIIY